MRDVQRRLATLEGRLVRSAPQWDLSHLSDDDLVFLEEHGRVESVAVLSHSDYAQLERIFLAAARREATA